AGIAAPKRTPADIVDKLNREINAGLVDPKMKARLADLGRTGRALLPTVYGKHNTAENEGWGKGITFASIKPLKGCIGSRICHNVSLGKMAGRSAAPTRQPTSFLRRCVRTLLALSRLSAMSGYLSALGAKRTLAYVTACRF